MIMIMKAPRKYPLGEKAPGEYAEGGLGAGWQESAGMAPLGQDLIIPEVGPTSLATLERTFR